MSCEPVTAACLGGACELCPGVSNTGVRCTCSCHGRSQNAGMHARCSHCDDVVGTVVTERGRATIRLSTLSHGSALPISCPNAHPGGAA